MEDKIRKVFCEIPRNYRTEPLPKSWVWSNDSEEIRDGYTRREILSDFLHRSNVICVLTSKLTDNLLLGLLHDLAEKRRVYIMLEKCGGHLDKLMGRCLIREGKINVNGTLILADPCSNTMKGFFISESLDDVTLKKPQLIREMGIEEEKIMEELFIYFCYNFWELASFEYISNKEVKEIKDKGVDVYFDPNHIHPNYLYDKVLETGEHRKREEFINRYITLKNGGESFFIKEKEDFILPNKVLSELVSKEDFEKSISKYIDECTYRSYALETHYKFNLSPFILPHNANRKDMWKDVNDKKKEITSKIIELIKPVHLYELESDNKIKSLSKELDRKYHEIWGGKETKEMVENFFLLLENIKTENMNISNKIDSNIGKLRNDSENSLYIEKRSQLDLLNKTNTLINASIDELKALLIKTIDSLPEVGELYIHNGNRYLAIEYWKDYNKGKEEAERLNAKLCALS
jgi:hypothetical protein